MDFVRRFEEHQVERIRRAVLAYRSKFRVGDVTLAKELLKFLPKSVTYESTLKNLQRLRTGEPMRGAAFLNACVQFLKVNMTAPPEEELGLAMQRFAGNLFIYEGLIESLQGDYAVQVVGESQPAHQQPVTPTVSPSGVHGIVVAVGRFAEPPARFGRAAVELSIGIGEGKDYGTASERYQLPTDKADEDSAASVLNQLTPTGVCLPVGGQDLLILMRDFLFSHMYVLKRTETGLAGTLILPAPYAFFQTEVSLSSSRSQYVVKLERLA